jgi:hypothetical protein
MTRSLLRFVGTLLAFMVLPGLVLGGCSSPIIMVPFDGGRDADPPHDAGSSGDT